MPKKLTVILGAGASYSLNPDPKALDNQGYRPPLAADIFRGNTEFRRILNRFPLAENLASDIDRKIRQNREGMGLEQILKEYETILNSGNESIIARNFLQIPLYLNELFGEISQLFTKQPDEYNNLVTQTTDKLDEVMFLTLNYDTLLEISLSRNFGIDFASEEQYINENGWSLIKLHGSTNWYHLFETQIQDPTPEKYLQMLKTVATPLPLQKEFTMSISSGYGLKNIGNSFIYPALTVPVDGKYDINCPESHQTKAKEFLTGCHNYLIIGTSGNDQDLLDLLKSHVRSAHVMLVGREEESTLNTKKKFMDAVPQFQNSIEVFHHQRGFSEFVDSGKLDEFLESLPETS